MNTQNTSELYDMAVFSREMANIDSARAALLSEGKELFDLSMINPDLPPSRFLVDRLVQSSLKTHLHKYGVSRGLKKLREAFVLKYKEAFSVNLESANSVCVTHGCKDGILQVLRATCRPKDKVLLLAPVYPAYRYAVDYLGLNSLEVQITSGTKLKSEATILEEIDLTLRENSVKLIVANFPHNPTGEVINSKFWSGLIALCSEHHCYVVNDFTYGEMVFNGGPAHSLLSVPGSYEFAVEIYSMSKAYNVPGWRVAAVLGNRDIVDAVSELKSHMDYGIFMPLQIAAAQALCATDNLVLNTTETYFRRAKMMLALMENKGWQVSVPMSGASVWAGIPESLVQRLGSGPGLSYRVTEMLLRDAQVLVLPGELFGSEYNGFVRFAMVLSEDKIRTAVSRILNVTE